AGAANPRNHRGPPARAAMTQGMTARTKTKPIVGPALPMPGLNDAIARSVGSLLELQHQDGHWVFELEADATIPAEYVLLQHYLGTPDVDRERKIAVYLRRTRTAEGGWPLLLGGSFNLSASVKGYLALKAIGDSPNAEHMREAREAILAHGGAGASNVFTR